MKVFIEAIGATFIAGEIHAIGQSARDIHYGGFRNLGTRMIETSKFTCQEKIKYYRVKIIGPCAKAKHGGMYIFNAFKVIEQVGPGAPSIGVEHA